MIVVLISAFLLSAVSSWALGWLAHTFLTRRRVFDRPNQRSSHREATVRGGGLAIVGTIVAGFALVCLSHQSLWVGCLIFALIPVAVISFLDDVFSISASRRIMVHSSAALVLLAVMAGLDPAFREMIDASQFSFDSILVAALLLFCVVGYANAFNFMDGINGLAAGQATLTGLGTALLVCLHSSRWPSDLLLAALVVAGAAAGFLPHNFPKARMFMGDVGSVPLGFVLATLVIPVICEKGFALGFMIVLLHANFVLDTGITLLRRIWRGDDWHAPHREHFYQRLTRAGWSHADVVCAEVLLQCLVLTSIVLTSLFAREWLWVCGVGSLIVWIGFFAFADRRFGIVNSARA